MQINVRTQIGIAASAVFAGSLLADIVFGDGVQREDVNQAIIVAAIAGAVQWFLASRK